jgi:hypothetical protein
MYMYVNGKKTSVETILGMRERWMENGGGAEF